MTDTTHRTRQPAGVTTGGQFATEPKAETTVQLPAGPDLEVERARRELDTLQNQREMVQEHYREICEHDPYCKAAELCRDDVEVMAMHLLARDTLDQYPTATHVVLTESDQGDDEMAIDEVRDADGNRLDADDGWGVDDTYTAASDMRLDGTWRKHATELEPGLCGERLALDLRAVVRSRLRLSGV